MWDNFIANLFLAYPGYAIFQLYFEHTGTTNNFHVQTRSRLAMIYNDRSVLENHHLSVAFRLLQNPDIDILMGLSAEEFKVYFFRRKSKIKFLSKIKILSKNGNFRQKFFYQKSNFSSKIKFFVKNKIFCPK